MASRAETPTRSSPVMSFRSAQRCVASIASSQRESTAGQLDLAGRAQRLDDLGQVRHGVCALFFRPDQRHRLGEIADEVPAPAEQHGIDARLDEAADEGGLGLGEDEAAGQRGEPVAAVGVGRLAEVGLDQPQLAVARGLEDEALEQLGEALHG